MYGNVARAWIILAAALALHVADEALNGFLEVYNPTAVAIREQAWLPLPVFRFDVWLAGLLAGVAAMLAVAHLVRRGSKWMRVVAYTLAVLMVLNALGHAAGTVAGRTVKGVVFSGPMPGVYSSPLLLAASVYLLYELRRKKVTSSRPTSAT